MIDDPVHAGGSPWWSRFKDATAFWRAPVIAGLTTGVGAWLVWYFTKVPCIMENAAAGLCNPGALANYINLPALASCLAIGGGFATFVGGYNIIMLNRERQRADEAEARAIKAQERADQIAGEVRERMFKIEEQRSEEHRLAMEALQEERRQIAANEQAMMNTLAEISAILAQLVQQQQNGHRDDRD